jgi:hypothetical protein
MMREEIAIVHESACISSNQLILVFVWEVAYHLHELTSSDGMEYHKKILKKCLKQSVLIHAMPNYVVKEKNRQ